MMSLHDILSSATKNTADIRSADPAADLALVKLWKTALNQDWGSQHDEFVTVHASCPARDGNGVKIAGRPMLVLHATTTDKEVPVMVLPYPDDYRDMATLSVPPAALEKYDPDRHPRVQRQMMAAARKDSASATTNGNVLDALGAISVQLGELVENESLHELVRVGATMSERDALVTTSVALREYVDRLHDRLARLKVGV